MDDEKYYNEDNCRKCGKKIGGQAYYVIEMDCIYDGDSVSGCEKTVVCSNCHTRLLEWFKH